MAMVFGEERDSPIMVTEGVFGIVRHPIYLGEALLYVGLLIWSMSLAAAVVWALAFGFLHYISRHEERLMLGIFGQEYKRYMEEVPMWGPRIRRR
jgi:protein-S-isoprenylcysteine O-methyltransferase Ste14